MDELWQKYRSFWLPILYGIGAFLLGLVVVHIVTDDPDTGLAKNQASARNITNRTAPSSQQIKGTRANYELLHQRTAALAARFDQTHGDATDPVEAYVTQAYRAAFLRGSAVPDESRFDGDRAAAAQAASRYEQLLREQLERVRSQDPNVSFSRIRSDIVQELLLRANRADVDLGPSLEEIGFTASAIPTVERADLPRRLASLALVATTLDTAIREGVRRIDNVTLLPVETGLGVPGPDAFLSLWPVKIDLTGPAASIAAVLNQLTDPARPTPLGTTLLRQTAKRDGNVRAEIKAYCVRVQPDAPLGLDTEGGDMEMPR